MTGPRRVITIGEDELEVMLTRAAKQGANEVLAQLGLHDEGDPHKASTDIRTLRDMLKTWKDIQASAVKGIVTWVANIFGLAFLIGLAVLATKGVSGFHPDTKP